MFFQLNTVSTFDFYQSCVLISEYAKRAKELSYDGISVVDHNLYSFPYLANECKKNNLKPIYGFQTTLKITNLKFDVSIFIKNETGYENLCLILSKIDDVITLKTLEKFKEGLILVVNTNSDFYSETFLSYNSKDFLSLKKVFEDDLYFGVTIDTKEDEQEVETLYKYTLSYSYSLIAYPKCMYIKKGDCYKRNILFYSQKYKNNLDAIDEIEKEGPNFLLSRKALESIYRKEDIEKVSELVSKIDFDFFTTRGKMISLDNEDEKLKTIAFNSLKTKVKENNEIYTERLKYELDVISKMHFSSYFLVVSDYVNFAKQNNIKVGPGRGSAGGSLVAYLLNITDIDPIKFDLSFERFLNPQRSTMPDIDLDFEDERRWEVVSYLKNKYGDTKVSEIVTFVKLKPKSALNLIGQVLHFNQNRLKKLTSSISDKANDFKEAMNDEYKGKAFKELIKDSYYKDICELANSLLGVVVNTSIHAPGVIISENPIYLSCPMKEKTHGTVLYEYENMEKLGFLKVDILSLSNLTFIKHIESKIIEKEEKLPDIFSNLNDEKVYKTLNELRLCEIFQLDKSYGMKDAIRQIKPTCFAHLAATIALYRPGPLKYIPSYARRKSGIEKVVYSIDKLEPILKETYGILIYQEQIIKAVQLLAKFSASEADLFRRAISKKQIDKMEQEKEKFINGCITNNISIEDANKVFDDILKFAEYGFNKSHAYCYSLIIYTLLYYKTYYPIEFYLTALEDNKNFNNILIELNSLNINIKTPDINISDTKKYVYSNNNIYLPLNIVVRNENLLKLIKEEREKEEFKSYYDFILRTNSLDISNDINALIDSGSFDSFNSNRASLKKITPIYINFAHFNIDSSNIPAIEEVKENLAEKVYLEKHYLKSILSIKLNQIVKKDNYKTYFISDISLYSFNKTITIEDETRQYKIKLNSKDQIEKNTFILIKENEVSKYNTNQINDFYIIKR